MRTTPDAPPRRSAVGALAVLALHLQACSAAQYAVFSTECTNYFDWQSVALFYSHQQVRQPGYAIRLMACDKPDKYEGYNIGPTYPHPNYGQPRNNLVQDHYTPYNKPGSLYHWLFENPEPPGHWDLDRSEHYVLVMEPDMFFRQMVDCEALGAKRGVVISAPYPYLEGASNGMAQQFIDAKSANNAEAVGGFYCIHLDDLKKVVPRWLNLTKEIRKNPQRYWKIDGAGEDFATGDMYVTRGHAPWISEMYGYIFAAAELGLQHVIREDVLLFAGTKPKYEPSILHYGLWCQVGERMFNKLSYKQNFNVHSCEQYFPEPPDMGLMLGKKPDQMGVELLCTEQIALFNEALCDYHGRTCCDFADAEFGCYDQKAMPLMRTEAACRQHCCDRTGLCTHYTWDTLAEGGPCFHSRFVRGECQEGAYKLENPEAKAQSKVERTPQCPIPAWVDVQRMQDEQNVVGGVYYCQDTDEACESWARGGECSTNEGFMRVACPVSCRIDGCIDKNDMCVRWAQLGECDSNFNYMVENCPVSCRKLREAAARPLDDNIQTATDAEDAAAQEEEPVEEEIENEEMEEVVMKDDETFIERENPDDDDQQLPQLSTRGDVGRRLRGAKRQKDGYRPHRVGKGVRQRLAPPPHQNRTQRSPSPPAPHHVEEEEELDWALIACTCLGLAALVTCCVRQRQRAAMRWQTKNL